jgi:hypothetical protein
MAKLPPTPVKVIMDSANLKLVGPISGKFTAGTTYSWVGPTCPTTCMFHPNSIVENRPAGFKACYATKGHVRFSTTEKAYEGATFDDLGLIRVRSRIDTILSQHISGDRIYDLFRWHTGGDILHPHTGEVWKEHVELIVDTAAKFMDVGIPLIGFTACWQLENAQPLKEIFLASVQTREDAQLAIEKGWHVAYAVPEAEYQEAVAFIRSLGEKVTGCPELMGKTPSCAQCGWCATLDPERLHVHKYGDYMLYRKKNKIVGLAGSTVFIMHN